MPFFSRPIYCIVPYSIPTYFTHVWQLAPVTDHARTRLRPFCACAICGVRGKSSIALTREPLVHVHVQGWEKRCASAVPCSVPWPKPEHGTARAIDGRRTRRKKQGAAENGSRLILLPGLHRAIRQRSYTAHLLSLVWPLNISVSTLDPHGLSSSLK